VEEAAHAGMTSGIPHRIRVEDRSLKAPAERRQQLDDPKSARGVANDTGPRKPMGGLSIIGVSQGHPSRFTRPLSATDFPETAGGCPARPGASCAAEPARHCSGVVVLDWTPPRSVTG